MGPIIICMKVKPVGLNQVNSYYTECCASKCLPEVNRTQSYDFSCTFNLRKYATMDNSKGQDKESGGRHTRAADTLCPELFNFPLLPWTFSWTQLPQVPAESAEKPAGMHHCRNFQPPQHTPIATRLHLLQPLWKPRNPGNLHSDLT